MKTRIFVRVFYLLLKMKRFLYLTVILLLLLQGCKNARPDYNPDACLPKEKQQKFLLEMVHYANRLAPEATHETKFDAKFNWYYERAVAESRILFCHLNAKDSTYELLVARKARSVAPMDEGIAVRIRFDKQDRLGYYEEVFRMWKMPSDTLARRGKFLFDRLVNNADLTLYYSKFQKDRFIEFPDDRFSFDIEKRKWNDRELDSLRLE
jgi:hypothetical protein